MRDSGNGPFGILLMLAPLIAVPVLAITGIPQFAPAIASPGHDDEFDSVEPRDLGVPETDLGESAAYSTDDLLAPLDTPSSELADFTGSSRKRASSQVEDAPRWSPPGEALDGWQIEPVRERPRARPEQFADASNDFPSDAPRHNSRFDADPVESLPAEEPATSTEESEENPFLQELTAPRTRRRGSEPRRAAPAVESEFPQAEDEVAQTGAAEQFPEEVPATRSRGRQHETANSAIRGQSPAALPVGRGRTGKLGFGRERPAPQAEDLTWQSAADRLHQLGISEHYFTYVPERQVFLFACSLPGQDEQSVAQRFEAEAPEPLLAVRQVLRQIEAQTAGVGQ